MLSQFLARSNILRKNAWSTLKIIWDAVSVIGVIASIVSGLALFGFLSWFTDKHEFLYIAGSFIAGMLVMFVIGVVMYSRSASAQWSVRGYRWVQAEYEYHILDDHGHHQQTLDLEVEATRNGVAMIQNRYQWTGRGEIELPRVTSAGQKLHGPVIRKRSWDYYYVDLGREFNVGERVNVGVTQSLLDVEGSFEPFLAKTVTEPVDKLVLRAIFPATREPINATCHEQFAAVPSNIDVQSAACKYNPNNRTLQWTINSPIFGRRYEIRWDYRS